VIWPGKSEGTYHPPSPQSSQPISLFLPTRIPPHPSYGRMAIRRVITQRSFSFYLKLLNRSVPARQTLIALSAFCISQIAKTKEVTRK